MNVARRLIHAALWLALVGGSGWECFGQAGDWPQWQGANRDSTWNEPRLVDAFPEGGPPVVWRKPVGSGYGGPAVAGGRLYLMDYQLKTGDPAPDPGKRNEIEGSERIVCMDAATGEWLWEQSYDCPYRISYPAGPRCTPTVVDDRVYTLGAEGRMLCLRADDGSILWEVDLKQRYGLKESPIWGFAAHPLVHGRMVYTMVGGEKGAAIALDRETGAEVWRACPSKAAGYCPPMIIEAGGTQQLVIWNPETINGVNPETGEVWWSFPLAPDYDMPIAAPTLDGDLLFACGEGTASILLRFAKDKPAAEEVWSGRGFHTSHSPVLLGDGHAYGVDLGGKLRCIALEDGKRKWDTEEPTCGGNPSSSGCAFIVRCGDRYLIAGEHGTLSLARMTPEKYERISSAPVIEPTQDAFGKKVIWCHPAFANGCCYWKNDKELVCVSLIKPDTETGAAGE